MSQRQEKTGSLHDTGDWKESSAGEVVHSMGEKQH